MLAGSRRTAAWFAAITAIVTAGPLNADDAQIERGLYLSRAGGCVTCHTEEEGGTPYAGGRALESPFGTFYSPNITPDAGTGIGDWTDIEFLRAFQEGVNPAGDAYFPAFPYTSYTGLSDEDLLAIKAYLFSLDPVTKHNRDHDLPVVTSSRVAAGVWKSRYFEPHRFQPDPDESESFNRGAYLVRHLGHCGECHTPRGSLGALDADRELAGNPDGPGGEDVPNITPHADGIGKWSVADIEYFLDIGMLPDGDFSGGSMGSVIEDNTSHLTEDDRRAIADYLKSLPPLPDRE